MQKCQKMGPNFPGPVMLVTKLCNKYKLWQNNLFARRLFPNSCQSTSRYLDKLQNNWDKTEKYAADQLALDLDVRSVDLCHIKIHQPFDLQPLTIIIEQIRHLIRFLSTVWSLAYESGMKWLDLTTWRLVQNKMLDIIQCASTFHLIF